MGACCRQTPAKSAAAPRSVACPRQACILASSLPAPCQRFACLHLNVWFLCLAGTVLQQSCCKVVCFSRVTRSAWGSAPSLLCSQSLCAARNAAHSPPTRRQPTCSQRGGCPLWCRVPTAQKLLWMCCPLLAADGHSGCREPLRRDPGGGRGVRQGSCPQDGHRPSGAGLHHDPLRQPRPGAPGELSSSQSGCLAVPQVGSSSAELCDSPEMCCGLQMRQPSSTLLCAWLSPASSMPPSSLPHSSPCAAPFPGPISATCMTPSSRHLAGGHRRPFSEPAVPVDHSFMCSSLQMPHHRDKSATCLPAPPCRWRQTP